MIVAKCGIGIYVRKRAVLLNAVKKIVMDLVRIFFNVNVGPNLRQTIHAVEKPFFL